MAFNGERRDAKRCEKRRDEKEDDEGFRCVGGRGRIEGQINRN